MLIIIQFLSDNVIYLIRNFKFANINILSMRFLQLFFIILVFSCKANSNNNGANSTDPNKEKQTEPIMGGPSDIKITLKDHPKSGVAKIIGFYSDQSYLADTVSFKNGVIQYTNPKGLAQGIYYLGVPDRTENLQLILGEDQKFELEVTLTDIINTIKIFGSEEMRVMYENAKYESQITPQIANLSNQLKSMTPGTSEFTTIKNQRDALDNERVATVKNLLVKYPKLLFSKYKNAGQNPKVREDVAKEMQMYYFRREFWDNVDFDDRRLLRTPVIGNKLKKYMKEFTAQNQDSIIASSRFLIDKVVDKPEYLKIFANWVVLNYEPAKCELMDAEAVFVSMTQNYFTKERAFWQDTLQTQVIQQRATEMAASLVGKKAPNVISKDQFGQKQELLSKTAEYLIVYMYNPECEHCQEQTPKLLDFYHANKATVDVFAIAVDTEDKKWKDYIAKNKLDWTNVYDPTNRSIYGKYFVDHTPELYVINKDRKIIGKNLKVFQIQTIIDRDKGKKS